MAITLILCLVLVGADQLIKYFVVESLKPIGAFPLIPGVIELRYVENDGAAFSLLSGQQGFLIAITAVALCIVGYILLFKARRFTLEWFAFLLILAGGVGNLIDRIVNRFVVDYINFLFVRFAVFNFADILVCVGFGLLVLYTIRTELADRKKRRLEAAGETGGADGQDRSDSD